MMQAFCIALAMLFVAVLAAGITSTVLCWIEGIWERQRAWTNHEHDLLVMTIRQVK